MRLRNVILGALLGLFSLTALAANPAPTGSTAAGGQGGGHMHGCQDNPQKCAELAAKFDKWCSANADKCQALKAGIERRHEFCENNKAECKEQREQMRADMKEWCSTHPDKPICKKMNEHEEDEDTNPPK